MKVISDWRERYADRVIGAEEAMALVQSGDGVYVHSHACEPELLVRALINRASELRGVRIVHLMTMGTADYVAPQYKDNFRLQALFIGNNVRAAINEGRADYTPAFLSEIPNMLRSRVTPIDVCLLQVSPPDAEGNCSLGPSVDCSRAAAECARLVIAEVNDRMPRTGGGSLLHISKIDKLIPVSRPLPQLMPEKPGEIELAIGRHVASLVPDAATLQLGIGAIPNAVLASLTEKKNLGLHSEMFSDGVIDLIESGVINNSKKTLIPGKSAVSFVFGSQRLYDFIDENPLVEFQACDFINDPFVIAQNHLMTSINSALEVDITGQVSADSIGTRLYSGFGGQVDFVRGASRAVGGKAIIALPSTAKGGKISRITGYLDKGSGVVTTRADVHYIVTEYGIAQLYGKTLQDRARALIAIAHPDFREGLERQAREITWL
ncbi:MAG: acetyl-CoA hydrolase/transferase family protein [Cyanobacteria bacterium SZAS TMP-1]|nr:acetyl-CoA hydrolase/transferase family protein [Cyanobacteria bacterium SZAS TMP-1]